MNNNEKNYELTDEELAQVVGGKESNPTQNQELEPYNKDNLIQNIINVTIDSGSK